MTACVGGDMRANMDVVVIDERRIVEIQFFDSSIRRLTLIPKKVVMPLTKPIRFGPIGDILVTAVGAGTDDVNHVRSQSN